MAVVSLRADDGSGRSLQSFAVPPQGGVLGRGEGAALVVDHPSISREHARFVPTESGWMVQQLSSTNGILVGGHRVDNYVFRDGEEFRLGELAFTFHYEDPRQASTVMVEGAGARQMLDALAAARSAPNPIAPRAPAPGSSAAMPAAPSPNKRSVLAVIALVLVGALVLFLIVAGLWVWSVWSAGKREHAARRAEQTAVDTREAGSSDGGVQAVPTPTDDSPAGGLAPLPPAKTLEVAARGARVLLDDGAQFLVPAGSLPAGSKLSVTPKEASTLALEGAKVVSHAYDVDTAGNDPTRDVVVTIPFDDTIELADGERIVVARLVDGELELLPSVVDPVARTVTARADHFSVTLAIATAAAAGGLYAAYDAWFGLDEDADDYPARIESKAGFIVHYHPTGPNAPAENDEAASKAYAQRVADLLDQAHGRMNGKPPFEGFEFPEALPLIYLRNTVDPSAPENLVMGQTHPTAGEVFFHSRLEPTALESTIPHELFHVLQIHAIGSWDAGTHRWWGEASCEWSAHAQAPAATLAGLQRIGAEGRSTPWIARGLPQKVTEENLNGAYWLGDFALFLDQACPGIVAASWRTDGGLNGRGLDSWLAGMNEHAALCKDRKLEEVIREYFLRYYVLGGTPIVDEGTCMTTGERVIVSEDKARHQLDVELPPYSAKCVLVNAHPELDPLTFVIAGGEGVDAHAFPAIRDGATYTMVAGTGPAVGVDMRGVPMGAVGVPLFGGKDREKDGAKTQANNVRIVLVNLEPKAVDRKLELYALMPPEPKARGMKYMKPGTRYTVAFDPPAMDPALIAGYRGTQRGKTIHEVTGNTKQWVYTEKGKTKFYWPRTEIVWIHLHTVDKYGNVSHASRKVPFTFDTMKKMVPLR